MENKDTLQKISQKQWDETLATEASQQLLDEMSEDTLKDFDLGNLVPINHDSD